MRKLLVALMMVAFAATAFAADVTFSGSYEFDGKYEKNYNLNQSWPKGSVVGNDGAVYTNQTQANLVDSNGNHTGTKAKLGKSAVTDSYYEHDLDLWMNVQTDKDTFFKTKLELVDATIGRSGNANSGYTPNSGDAMTDGQYSDTTQLSLQRAWMGHNFGDVTLEAGLMDSGTWGYSFGDNLEGSYRIKATFNNVAGGKLNILTQKKSEATDLGTNIKDANKDDGDKYSIGYKATYGNLFIAPKIDYDINSNKNYGGDNSANDTKVTQVDFAAGYTLNALTLQAEAIFNNTKYADETATRKDYTSYGWFVNAAYAINSDVTVGVLSAYGSGAKDKGHKAFSFGDDFDSTFILGDDLSVGDQSASGDQDLGGFWANAVYTTYQATEKLGLMAKFAYATSNWSSSADKTASGGFGGWKTSSDTYGVGMGSVPLHNAKAWEADASATYAITKALSYYVNAGYAKVNLDGATDPDAIILVKHGLILSF